MRVRRAQDEGAGLSLDAEIVGIAAAAGQKPMILDSLDRLPDAELAHVQTLFLLVLLVK